MTAHQLSASVGGIGFLKGGGTYAAIVTILAWWLVGSLLPYTTLSVLWQIAATLAITALGIWNGNVVEPAWGKDSSRVVIDEVAGMCLTLIAVPFSWQYLLAGLVLFRFFDIVKPLGVRRMEALPGGWGVMADDVLAGIYANLALQLLVNSLHDTAFRSL